MTAYYNEFDPKAAAWLRELINMDMIAPGVVDDRSILDVTASDLKGFTQHHFFAGIGVWSYALRNAGWSDDRPVCTASLPCQPFSTAGNQKGKDDERHLLPHFVELVRECEFDTIFGEQVESAIRHGWLDDLQTNMEAEGYAIGHCVLGAHSAGAAHQRQRLFWVANSGCERLQRHRRSEQVNDPQGRQKQDGHIAESSVDSRAGNTNIGGSQSRGEATETARHRSTANSASGIDWIYCKDEKYRPIKSGVAPLVDGIARGVVYSGGAIDANNTAYAKTIRLKGYGNAINADIAAEFISAFMEIGS